MPSATTLLGLVKHATFVEKVWFDEAVTCRSRAEIGIPATPDESFVLDDGDTVASVKQAHREACEASRRATAPLGIDDVVRGNRRGPLPLRWVYFHSASSPSTAGMPTSCASRSSRPDPRSRTSGRRPAAVSRRAAPGHAEASGRFRRGAPGRSPRQPCRGPRPRSPPSRGTTRGSRRATGSPHRPSQPPRRRAGCWCGRRDGGLRVDSRRAAPPAQGRDAVRHRTRVQDLLEGGEVEVQGGREVVGLREPGDHGAEVEVHRELAPRPAGTGPQRTTARHIGRRSGATRSTASSGPATRPTKSPRSAGTRQRSPWAACGWPWRSAACSRRT